MTTVISGTTGITFPDSTIQTTANFMWIPLSTCTYTFSDAPTFQFLLPNNANLYLSLGSKIQLTQLATVKYFIVTAIGAYSGSTTLITVYGGTDYTLTNNTITSASYSNMKSPMGFPLNPEKWTVSIVDTVNNYGTGATGASTWYYLVFGGVAFQLSVPIGMWTMSYAGSFNISGGAANTGYLLVTLSTSTSELDKKYTTNAYGTGSQTSIISLTNGNHTITQSAKTTWYLLIQSYFTGCTAMGMGQGRCGSEIRALCAYL